MENKTLQIYHLESRRGFFRLLQAYVQANFNVTVERNEFEKIDDFDPQQVCKFSIVDLLDHQELNCKQVLNSISTGSTPNHRLCLVNLSDVIPDLEGVKIVRAPIELFFTHSFLKTHFEKAEQIEFGHSQNNTSQKSPMDKMLLEVLRKLNRPYLNHLKFSGSLNQIGIQSEEISEFSELLGFSGTARKQAEESFKNALGALQHSQELRNHLNEILLKDSPKKRHLNAGFMINLITTALVEKISGLKEVSTTSSVAFSEVFKCALLSTSNLEKAWNYQMGEIISNISGNDFYKSDVLKAQEKLQMWELCPENTNQFIGTQLNNSEMNTLQCCHFVAQEFVNIIMYQKDVDVLMTLEIKIKTMSDPKLKFVFETVAEWIKNSVATYTIDDTVSKAA